MSETPTTEEATHSLRLWNPLDYLRLLYWLFFRYQSLFDYAEAAAGESEDATGRAALRALVGRPRLRNLLLQQALLTGGLVACSALIAWALGYPVGWANVAVGVAFGVAVGVAFGVAVGVAFGVAYGVTVSVSVGVAVSVAVGVGVGVGAAFGVGVGVAFGVGVGVALGVAGGVGGNVSAAFGAGGGVAGGVVGGMAGGVAGAVVKNWGPWAGLTAALIIGATFWFLWFLIAVGFEEILNRALRRRSESATLPYAIGLVLLLGLGLLTGFATSLLGAMVSPWLVALLVVAAGLHLPVYPIAVIATLIADGRRSQAADPNSVLKRWLFDDAMLLPLPGLAGSLVSIAEQDWWAGTDAAIWCCESTGHWLEGISALRHLAQRSPYDLRTSLENPQLIRYVFSQPKAVAEVRLGYDILLRIGQKEDIGAPTRRERLGPEARAGGTAGEAPSPLALLDEALGHFRSVTVTPLPNGAPVPHGEEVNRIYGVLRRSLSCRSIDDIAALPPALKEVAELTDDFLSPLSQLSGDLADVAARMEQAINATRREEGQALLLKAQEALLPLANEAQEVPDLKGGAVARLVIDHWRDIASASADKVGRRGLRQPIDNPYIAGVPVAPPLFRGRGDIYRRIHQLWSGAQARKPPIILYGHRRMGKSSILRNLPFFLPNFPMLLVYLDMSGATVQISDAELWADIAAALARELGRAGIAGINPPPEASFRENWRRAMDAYLIEQVGPALRPNLRVALALDEFEAIEKAIRDEKITVDIIRYLRYLSQHNEMPWLTVILGGLHTLEEMTHDYWNPFFRSIETIKVGYMAPDVAQGLLTNPSRETFPLAYDPEVIATILDRTACQPYLVQLCGQLIVEAWNNRFLDGSVEVAPRITGEDWDRSFPLVFERGGYYFTGVWGGSTAEEQLLLRTMATERAESGWSEQELAEATGMSIEALDGILKQAIRHDTLIQGDDGRWRFIVPLMREWVAADSAKTPRS